MPGPHEARDSAAVSPNGAGAHGAPEPAADANTARRGQLETGVLYQDSRWPLLAWVWAVGLCWPLAVIALALVDLIADRGAAWIAVEAVLLGVVALGFAVRRPRMGFVLTEEAVELRGLVRNRSIPVREVTRFGLRLINGGPDARVVLERTDGSAVAVPGLVFLSQADEIGRMIGPWCLASDGVRLMQSEVLTALNTHVRRASAPHGDAAGARRRRW